MDATPSYQVIFSGKLRDGFTLAQVQTAMCERLKLPRAKLEQFFSGRPVVLKRTDSVEEARRLVSLLASLGAISRIHADKGAKEAAAKQAIVKQESLKPSVELPRFSPYPKGVALTASLFLAAATELFFGLLYLLLLCAFSLGLVYYNLFTTWGAAVTGFGPLALLLQVITLLAGLVVLFLLAKPLLSFYVRQRQGITLEANKEPDLHLFVQDVCEQIGAPLPREIRINNDVDVSMDYQGALGLLRKRCVLTIGSPLVAACDTSQLAALIAQSLQLFHNKSLSPRAAYLLRGSDGWLHRAIYGEDAIDRQLNELAADSDTLATIAAPLQRLIALSRRVLGWRLVLSRRLNRRLIHRLVADADKVSLIFTGSAGFSHLMQQQHLLAFTSQQMLPTLQQRWLKEGTLPDNLVQTLVQHSQHYPETIHQQLRAQQEREKAASGDTIPADVQRLRRVSKNEVPAAYPCHSAATGLFRNFDKLARTMTVRYYHNRLAIPITANRLLGSTTDGKQQPRLDAIFAGLHCEFLPLKLRHAMTMIGSYEEGIAKRSEALAEATTAHPHASLTLKRYREAEQAMIDIHTQEVIYRAGLWRQWGVEPAGRDGLEQVHLACREQENAFNENLDLLSHQLKPHVQRLAATLALLDTPQAARLNHAAALQREVAALTEVLERIEQAGPRLRTLRLHTNLLQTLLSYDAARRGKQHDLIQEQVGDIQQQLAGLGATFKTTPYPFGAAHPNLMEYALRHAYDDTGPEGELDRGNDVATEVSRLEQQALTRLCAIALHTEKSLGL